VPFWNSLIKKILNAAYFLIYQRTTEFGTSKEIFKNNRLGVEKSLGKENASFLYLLEEFYSISDRDLVVLASSQ
jgi:hypothetical protein